jgi:hypothetical protein
MIVRTTVFTCVVLAASSSAQAQAPATNNACWGDVTSDLAQLEKGIIGQHSRAHDPVNRPEQQPREGVGNVSKGFGELSQGGQGEHAEVVGGMVPEELGGPIECDQF